MKKVFAWVMAAVMLLSMGTISASASRQHHGRVVSQITTGLRSACVKVEHRYRSCGSCGVGHCGAGRYVDADGNGLCDRCGYEHCGIHQGNGGCGSCGVGHCWGGYADADGDGLCDNCGYEHCGAEGAHACGSCGVSHCWGGFVDADGDSLCDNCGYIHCGAGFVDEDGDGLCGHDEMDGDETRIADGIFCR